MSKEDKLKLEGLQNYTHPETHAVTMITGLATVATTGNYEHLINKPMIPTTLPASGGNSDTVDNYHATDFTPANHVGTNGVSHAAVTTTTNGFMIATDKIKLEGITANATKTEISSTNGYIKINGLDTLVYTHPDTHEATIIHSSETFNGILLPNTGSATLGNILQTIDDHTHPTYIHPMSHPAMMIEVDVNNFSGNLNYNAYNVQEALNMIDSMSVGISADIMRKFRNGGI
jgi:hypothetical protein